MASSATTISGSKFVRAKGLSPIRGVPMGSAIRRWDFRLGERLVGAFMMALGAGGAWLLMPHEDWFDDVDAGYVLIIGPLIVPAGALLLIPVLFAVGVAFAGLGLLVAPGRVLGETAPRKRRRRPPRRPHRSAWTDEVERQWRIILRDKSATRTKAKRALAQMGAPAVPLLVEVLKAPKEWLSNGTSTHSKAIRILDLMGNDATGRIRMLLNAETMRQLAGHMDKSDFASLQATARARTARPSEYSTDTDAVVPAASAASTSVTAGGVSAVRPAAHIEQMRARGDIEALVAALHSVSPGVSEAALRAITEVADVNAVAPLRGAIDDQDPAVRCRAARALGATGAPEALDPLIEALSDPSTLVRWHAVTALGRLGDQRAVRPLQAALDDPLVSTAALKALQRVG
jgi:hypothetical protein